jgi:hypothetical protein
MPLYFSFQNIFQPSPESSCNESVSTSSMNSRSKIIVQDYDVISQTESSLIFLSPVHCHVKHNPNTRQLT